VLPKREIRGEHFDKGGFYHWVVRREKDGQWKIASILLTITWTLGEDLEGVSGLRLIDGVDLRLAHGETLPFY
jgi:hypothetical protein